MTVEFAINFLVFLNVFVFVAFYIHKVFVIRKAVKDGDHKKVSQELWMIPFLTRGFRDKLCLKAMRNRDIKELEAALARRREVVELFKKIPGIRVKQTGIEGYEERLRRLSSLK